MQTKTVNEKVFKIVYYRVILRSGASWPSWVSVSARICLPLPGKEIRP